MDYQPGAGEEEARELDMTMKSKRRVEKDAAGQGTAACCDGEGV